MWRLPLFALVWLVYAALVLPLLILGIPVVALMAAFPTQTIVMRYSRHYPDRWVLTWQWRWLDVIFGNDEDGLDGLPIDRYTGGYEWPFGPVMQRQRWWLDKTRDWPVWRRIFVWSALRNSNANLRFLPFFGMKINPSRMSYASGDSWWLVWQGPRAGFRWFWSAGRCFWIGWKMKPSDTLPPFHEATELHPTDSRAPGVGFAFQPYGSV